MSFNAVPPLIPSDLLTTNLSTTTASVYASTNVDHVVTQSVSANTVTVISVPTANTDATNKIYVDNYINNIIWKESCRVASTTNIDLTTGGLIIVDGIQLQLGDRVLIKDQLDNTQNGIYNAQLNSWIRSTDATTIQQATGSFIYISSGFTNATYVFYCNTIDINNKIVNYGVGISFVILNTGSGSNPGIPLNSIQFNKNNTFGGSSKFLYDGTSVIIGPSTNSTSISSGSLVVSGGIGISGTAYIGTVVSTKITGLSNPILSSDATNKSYVDGLSSVSGSNTLVQYNYNGSSFGSSGNFSYNGSTLFVYNTTGSTNISTGSLVLSGGLGLSGTLNSNNANLVTIVSSRVTGLGTPSISSDAANKGYVDGLSSVTGSNTLVQYNYNGSSFGSSGNFSYNGSTLFVYNTTVSTNISTGSLVLSGGLGLAGTLNANNATITTIVSSRVTGLLAPSSNTDAVNKSYVDGLSSVTGSNTLVQYNYNGSSFGSSGNFSYNGSTLFVYNTTASTNIATGSLVLAGGLGIGGVLNIAGPAYMSTIITTKITGLSTPVLSTDAVNKAYVDGVSAVSGSNGLVQYNYNGTSFGSSGNFSYNGSSLYVYNTTASTNISTGSLVLSGGLGIGGVLNITGSSYMGTIITTKITGLTGPIAPTDAVNKAYVDGVSSVSGSNGLVQYNYNGTSFGSTGNFSYNGSTLFVYNTTASTNVSTGSLVLSGGLGLGGTLNSSNANIVTIISTKVTGLSAPVLSSDAVNKGYVDGLSLVSGSNTLVQYNYNGSSFGSSGNFSYNGSTLFVYNTTASTNVSTGSLVLSGGLGVLGTSYQGTIITTKVTGLAPPVFSTDAVSKIYVDSLSSVSGSNGLVQYNYNGTSFGSTGNFSYNGSALYVYNVTPSTNQTTGSLVLSGGLGVLGSSYLGTIITTKVTGLGGPVGPTDAVNKAYVDGVSSVSGSNGLVQYNYNGTSFGSSGNFSYNGSTLYVYNTTVSTNQTTGSLVLSGGLGVLGTSYQGTIITTKVTGLGGPVGPTDAVNKAYVDGVSSVSGSNSLVQYNYNGTSFGSSGNFSYNGSTLYVYNNTGTTDVSTGSLVLSGGLGVSGSSYIGSSLTVGGSVYATSYLSLSDMYVKTNIEPLENSIDIINKMKPCSYNFINNSKNNKQYGFIAQQLEEVYLGDLVEKHNNIKVVNYTPIIAFLVDAIQELHKEIKEIKDNKDNKKKVKIIKR